MSNRNNLTDKGWKNMNALLDHELPQQHKKRDRMGWLFMFLILALLAGWLGVRLTQHNGAQALQNDSASQQQTCSPAQASAQPNLATADPTMPQPAKPSLQTLSIGIHQPVTVAVPQRFPLQHAIETPQHTENKQPINETELNILRYTPVFWPKGLELPRATLSNPTNTHQATNLLPAAPLSPLESKTHHGIEARFKEKHHSKWLRLDWSLVAAVNLLQVKTKPGWVFGGTIEGTAARSKFGLQSGLLYRYQQFAGESRPTVPVTYDSYLKATGNRDVLPSQVPNSWVSLTTNNRIIVPVMASHQLEAPLMLFYKATPRFRILAGMTFLRHVWIESANKGLITYDLKVVTTPNDDAQGNLNNIITGQLPKWENNWQTGIAFQPMRRLELGLYYRSTWNGTPTLSNFNALFNSCRTCDSKYPQARVNTQSSIRPFSVQFNIHYKF